MVFINDVEEDEGLNGLKIGKWIKRNVKSAQKDISIKNAVKVVKVAAPIALSLAPVVGGSASGVLSKVLKNSDGTANAIGRTVNTIQNSKVASTLTKLSKTPVGSLVTKNVKTALKTAANNIGGSSGASVGASNLSNEAVEPVGVLTPVTPADNKAIDENPKDNTMLYLGGALLLGGAIYWGTRD